MPPDMRALLLATLLLSAVTALPAAEASVDMADAGIAPCLPVTVASGTRLGLYQIGGCWYFCAGQAVSVCVLVP